MPRKHKTEQAALLNRENQRRCRARRRVYIEDLELRVREYERLGVQATTEMQIAARSIAAENHALRSLLLSRGLTDADIDAHIRETIPATALHLDHPSMRPSNTVMSVSCLLNEQGAPDKPLSPESPPQDLFSGATHQPEGPQSLARQASAFESPPQNSMSLTSEETEKPPKAPWAGGPGSPTEWTYLNRAKLPEPKASVDTIGEKSCEEAAKILARLRGDSELSAARHDLGCSEGDCSIRNIELLGIMGKYP